MPLTNPRGKTAVVTGGASGIGLALARRLTAEGMQVVLADCEPEALSRAADDLGVLGLAADVRDPVSLQALAAAVVERFGGVSLVCANAGVSRMAAAARLTPGDWRWLFDVNVFGVVNTVQAFRPALEADPDGGHILITASLSSLYPTRAQAGYAASKYAVAGFGETLALELQAEGSKVGVSLLMPGPVRTNIGTSARNRGPEYASGAALPTGPDLHEQAFRASVAETDWRTPEQIADAAIEGVRRGDLWIITHPQMMGPVLERSQAIAAAGGVSA